MAQKNLQAFKEELLKKLASKKDLEKFATKKYLGEFATKQDLQKVKLELENRILSLEQKVDNNSASIGRLVSEVITINENMMTKEEHLEYCNRILEKQQKIINMLDEMIDEMAAQDAKSYRLETDIEAESRRNDSRIKKLESVAG